jgi:tetratricopeptide (TPR) repeat protein
MNAVSRIAFLLSALLAPSAVLAGVEGLDNPELRAALNGVRDDAHAAALDLRRLEIQVEIRGAVAETIVDAAFDNRGSAISEGDFRFAMPEGAVVTGYALNIGDKMIDGVLVDRPRAKLVYDQRVRQRIDPGLAEVKPGNVFETHVHPIFPGAGRRIRLRFVTPLGVAGLRLPLHVAAPSQGYALGVHVTGAEAPPALTLPGTDKAPFERSADGFAAKVSGAGALDGVLAVARPEGEALVSAHRSGERTLQLGGALPGTAGAPQAAEKLRIYWDRSRSRLDARLDDEIELVKRTIAAAKPREIELVAFNSSGARRKTVASAEEAGAWLKALSYRGASSFSAIAHDPAGAHCLLFSGGKPAIDLAVEFAPQCRLDAVASGAGADRAFLRHLAQSHGGGVHDPNPSAADALSRPFAGVIGVTDRDGKPVPFIPLEAPAGRWLALVRSPEGGKVKIRLGAGGVQREENVTVDTPAVPFDGPAALVASDRLAALSGADRRAEFVDLSRKYGIASPSLSFLVLEQPFDYLQAKIDPPTTYPAEARDDYFRQRKAADAARDASQAAWLNALAGAWAEQVNWHRTKFDPKASPRQIQTSEHFDRPAAPAPVAAPPAPGAAPEPSSHHAAAAVDSLRRPGPRSDGAESGRETVAQASASKLGEPAAAPAAGRIEIDAWQPDRPYLELFDGKPSDFDERFLEAQKRHGGLPIFYLDTAEWLRKQGKTAEASEMALAALDLPTANDETLGIVADRLERYGDIDRALELRERQAALDPDRPHPRRLLALALARRAALAPERARADLERAIGLLYAIATTRQDQPWSGIEQVALNEANALLPRLRAAGGDFAFDPRLVALLDVDLRVVIDWTTDGSDMDLWVDEPNKERAIYNNNRTAIGGRLSRDMTRGYGPEEYELHVAPAGDYAVHANVFAPDRLDPNGATLLTAHLFRDFGRPDQSEDSVSVELKRDEKGAKLLGHLIVDGESREKKIQIVR